MAKNGNTVKAPTETIDLARLLKLRLVVARFGEMDCAGWWNTKGVLGQLGKKVFQRGFPKTHLMAQAQVAFAVASQRCAEVFSPPAHVTLWSLPAVVEDAFRRQWSEWNDGFDSVLPVFQAIESIDGKDISAMLKSLGLIDAGIQKAVKDLKVSANGCAVLIPGTHKLDNHLITLLAAAFARGGKSDPVIPYAAVEVAA